MTKDCHYELSRMMNSALMLNHVVKKLLRCIDIMINYIDDLLFYTERPVTVVCLDQGLFINFNSKAPVNVKMWKLFRTEVLRRLGNLRPKTKKGVSAKVVVTTRGLC